MLSANSKKSLYRRDYAYSLNGNLDQIADTRHGQRSYQYDPLNRLIRVRHSRDAPPETFAHDPAGNLLMQDRPGAAKVMGNRLLMQGDRHYDYDAFGNLIRERRGTAQKNSSPNTATTASTDWSASLPRTVVAPATATTPSAAASPKPSMAKTTEFFFWQGDNLVAESSKEHYRSYLYEPGSFRPLAMLDGKGPKKRPARFTTNSITLERRRN